jgi:hypothetical protein
MDLIGWRGGGCSSGKDFLEAELLAAIQNRQLALFVLPHRHPAARRGTVLALSLQLQQARFVAHHLVGTHATRLLQPEQFVQLRRRRPPRVIVRCRGRRPCVAPVVFGQVVPVEVTAGLFVVRYAGQTQLLHQPALVRAVGPLHAPLVLWRVGADNADA